MCQDHGVYPWNESIITPLHKKGNKSDPDNYRAIAVSSVIGKLFSSMETDQEVLASLLNMNSWKVSPRSLKARIALTIYFAN